MRVASVTSLEFGQANVIVGMLERAGQGGVEEEAERDE